MVGIRGGGAAAQFALYVAPVSSNQRRQTLLGAAYATAAFGAWGLFPIYFKALKHVPPLEVLCHRIMWSALFTLVCVAITGQFRSVIRCVQDRRVLLPLCASTILIATNWLLFIQAVASNRVMEASLGYFLNPLANVLLGSVFLRERMSPMRKVAVALAAAGVLVSTLAYGSVPWLALALAASFSVYGLLRKTTAASGITGLFVETALLWPLAATYLLHAHVKSESVFGGPSQTLSLLLLAAGPITAIPLIMFANATKRLPLSAVGFFQYLSPTGQFLLAVLVFGEPFTREHVFTFAFIWMGVAVFLFDLWTRREHVSADRGALDALSDLGQKPVGHRP